MILDKILQHIFVFLYGITANYGFSLILLSLTVTIIMIPLFWIAEKIKDRDRAKRLKMKHALDKISTVENSQEKYFYTREIYKKNNYHPINSMAGLLGLAIQIPFFIAAYKMIGHFDALSGVSFGIINDLMMPDSLIKFYNQRINLLPVLMTVINIISGYLYSNNMDRSEKKQLLLISGIFLVLLYNMPSALVLYWTMNNFFGIGKNYLLAKIEKKEFSKIDLKFLLLELAGFIRERQIGLLFFSAIIVLYFGAGFYFCGSKVSSLAQFYVNSSLQIMSITALFLITKNFKNRKSLKSFLLQNIPFFIIELPILLVSVIQMLPKRKTMVLKLLLLMIFSIHILINIINAYKKDNKVKDFFNRTNSLRMGKRIPGYYEIILFIFIVFTVTPLYVYYSSPKDFGGTTGSFIKDYITVLAVSSAVLSVFYLIMKKMRNILIKVTASATVLSVIFGYLYQKNFGIMRNFRFVNQHLLDTNLFTSVIDLMIILSVIYFIFKYYSKHRSLVLISLTLIFSIQSIDAVKFINTYYRYNTENTEVSVKNPIQTGSENKIKEYEKRLNRQFSYSKDKQNIIVIVMDAFPAFLMDEFLNEHPEFLDMMDGFTWYRNTVSVGSFTLPSVNSLYGGYSYSAAETNRENSKKGLTYYDANKQAVFKHYNFFKENGFTASYYHIPFFTDNIELKENGAEIISSGELANYWRDNIPEYASEEAKRSFFGDNSTKLKKQLLKDLTLFKILPYVFKNGIYSGSIAGDKVNGVDLDEIRGRYSSTESIYNAIENIVNTDSRDPVIKFFWTYATVKPYHINEKGNGPPVEEIGRRKFSIRSSDSAKITMYYLLNKIYSLSQKLKQENIYDNTTIVLASDHGSSTFDGDTWNSYAIFPLLMVKENNKRGKMNISDKLMTNADIFAITSASVTGKSADIIPDPTNKEIDRKAYYWVAEHGNSDSLSKKEIGIEYGIEVSKNVYDTEKWRKIDYKTYISEKYGE